MKLVLGIDEAGRGPVIGPLAVCGVLCEESKIDKLKELGAKDSKTISTEQRTSTAKTIKKFVDDYHIVKISPKVIEKGNLNTIEFDVIVKLINKFKPQKVIIDTPVSPGAIANYSGKLRTAIDENIRSSIELIIEPKADANYPVVGAASILAKVERDNEIEKLHEKYGDFGSGYPSDPKTYEFIKHWNKFPEIVRKNWSTCESILIAPGKIMVISETVSHNREFCKSLINAGLEKGLTVGFMNLDIVSPCIGPIGSIGFCVVDKMLRSFEKIAPGIMHPFLSEELIANGLQNMITKLPQKVNFIVINSPVYCRNIVKHLEVLKPDKIIILESGKGIKSLPPDLSEKYNVYKLPYSVTKAVE